MKVIAFRIWDFKSITDSGECLLSADNITVLAGQNESGKTAILQALRDFDSPVDAKPRTPDYTPDGRLDSANPRVAVSFSIDQEELDEILKEEKWEIPADARTKIIEDGYVWVVRDLPSGTFDFRAELQQLWKAGDGARTNSMAPPEAEEGQEEGLAAEEEAEEEAEAETTEEETGVEHPIKRETVSSSRLASTLHSNWPLFVYFESFGDTLPRTVDVSVLQTAAQAGKKKPGAASPGSTVPRAVQDYIVLSGLDLEVIEKFSTEDKALYNYLSSRSAHITGDFLTYWQQKAGKEQTVTLQVRHQRSPEGVQQLAFYVHDQTDQYPEQRSKGFLWFLSFYLRLAAEHLRDPHKQRLLLIDEPGTYLHARAQKDVLHLLQDRLSKKDQIIYSSHSPFLIPSSDKLHRLRIVAKTPDTGTVILDRLTHPLLRGPEFSDTLSPILSAIGMDIREAIGFIRERNLVVEGIVDHYYLSAWSRLIDPHFIEQIHIFPAAGAPSVVTLASLFIGWGIEFAALLDRDPNGNAARDKLTRELGVSEERAIQPEQALGIEDLFSEEDFGFLLTSFDPALTINQGERPTNAIKRQRIDKVLLARRFSEEQSRGAVNLNDQTRDRVRTLLNRILHVFPGA